MEEREKIIKKTQNARAKLSFARARIWVAMCQTRMRYKRYAEMLDQADRGIALATEIIDDLIEAGK